MSVRGISLWLEALRAAIEAKDVYIVGAEDRVLTDLLNIVEAAQRLADVRDGNLAIEVSSPPKEALRAALRAASISQGSPE